MKPPPTQPRVVLVDDEPYILQALQRLFRREGYEIGTYEDPLAALAGLLEGGEPAVIVSDNLMPGLKGLDLLRRAAEALPRTRRVLLTGHTELNEAVDAFNQGIIHRFINKPWSEDDLRTVLREETGRFQAAQGAREASTDWKRVAREKHAQLTRTVQELKQAQTQVALYEDTANASSVLASAQLRRQSFLVVEGVARVRQVMLSSLQRAGVQHCHAVGSAAEALAHLRLVPRVDVVLSEWDLPDMDGLELLFAIRSEQTPSVDTRFVLMTTREHRRAVEEALQSGVDYYLIKPFHLHTLFEQLERRQRAKARGNSPRRIAQLRTLSFVVGNIDQDARYRLQQILLLHGIQNVSIVDSGAKALRVAQQKSVDVMIVDCNLRDVMWEEFVVTLNQTAYSGTSPVLVVTSESPVPEEFEDVKNAGISTFLPGRVQQRDVFDAIIRSLEQRGMFPGPNEAHEELPAP